MRKFIEDWWFLAAYTATMFLAGFGFGQCAFDDSIEHLTGEACEKKQ